VAWSVPLTDRRRRGHVDSQRLALAEEPTEPCVPLLEGGSGQPSQRFGRVGMSRPPYSFLLLAFFFAFARCLSDGPLLGASAQSYRVSTGTARQSPEGDEPPS